MKKFFKALCLLLASILVIFIVTVGLLITFVNPNKIKPLVTTKISQLTSRPVTIEGDISWTLFPNLGIKIGRMIIDNPQGASQKTFAEINEVIIDLQLKPLLHSKLEFNGITFSDIKLHLSNNTIIKKFKLHAENINLEQSFPLSGSFVFVSQSPAATGQIEFASQVNINRALHKLTFSNVTAQSANLTLKGNVDVTNLDSKPEIQGHFNLLPMDLRKWLVAIGQNPGNLQVAKEVSGDFDVNSDTPVTLKTINIEGKFKVDELQTGKLKASNLTLVTHLKNGVLNFDPVTAAFYQGSLQSQIAINLIPTVPTINAKATLSDVQAEPLIVDLWGKDKQFKIRGMGNISLHVTTQGLSKNSIVRNLNGTSKFDFKNGVLEGINIGHVVDSAYAYVKQQPLPAENEKATHFGLFTGTAIIKNGVIANNDLLLDSPRFETKGEGTIDLVNQQIDYQLQSRPKGEEQVVINNVKINLHDIVLPIRVAGSLDHPSIRLDTAALAKTIAVQQIQKVQDKIKEKIKEKIKDKVHGKTGELLKNLLGN